MAKLTLSRRETEAVFMLAQGYRTKEAAFRMGVSTQAVRDYLNRARGKFMADTLCHLVALAMIKNVIQFDEQTGQLKTNEALLLDTRFSRCTIKAPQSVGVKGFEPSTSR